jgi:hypothetical protein
MKINTTYQQPGAAIAGATAPQAKPVEATELDRDAFAETPGIDRLVKDLRAYGFVLNDRGCER